MTGINLSVYVRIALYVLTGVLMRGGWLPPDASIFFTDPSVVEAVTAAVVGLLTLRFTARHERGKADG